MSWSSPSFSVGGWPGSLQAAMTSCAVSAAFSALGMHSILCLGPLSGDAGFFSHLLDWNIQQDFFFLMLCAFVIVDFVLLIFFFFNLLAKKKRKEKSFKNCQRQGTEYLSHIWCVELGLPEQWRLDSELSVVSCLERLGITSQQCLDLYKEEVPGTSKLELLQQKF